MPDQSDIATWVITVAPKASTLVLSQESMSILAYRSKNWVLSLIRKKPWLRRWM